MKWAVPRVAVWCVQSQWISAPWGHISLLFGHAALLLLRGRKWWGKEKAGCSYIMANALCPCVVSASIWCIAQLSRVTGQMGGSCHFNCSTVNTDSVNAQRHTKGNTSSTTSLQPLLPHHIPACLKWVCFIRKSILWEWFKTRGKKNKLHIFMFRRKNRHPSSITN